MYNLFFAFIITFSTCLFGADIQFFHGEDGALTVHIHTERLFIRSIEETDGKIFENLFADKDAMEKFVEGELFSPSKTEDYVRNLWASQWKRDDPYSGFAIFHNDTGEFIGFVGLTQLLWFTECELSYILEKEHWGQGYAKEAAAAVVKEYVPKTIEEGYNIFGRPIKKITAEVRVDNPASEKILKSLGMYLTDENVRNGLLWHYYSIDID